MATVVAMVADVDEFINCFCILSTNPICKRCYDAINAVVLARVVSVVCLIDR